MTPRDELLTTRRIGEAGANLLYRTVRAVAVSRGFPPPEGSTRWDDQACQEVAHDFIRGERGFKRLLDLALRSVDDRSFERLLEAAVHNHLRDVARATPMGKLIVRIKEVLREAPEFTATPSGAGEAWALSDGPTALSTVNATALAAAIRRTAVRIPKWASESRDAPLADHASFVRLIRTVLVCAQGSVSAPDLAFVVATRLDVRRTPLTVELDGLIGGHEPASAEAEPGALVAGSATAQTLFNTMSERERVAFARVDASVRELALVLHLGKSQAAQVRQRLMDRLQLELADDENPEETVSVLAQLCESWIESWTIGVDTTSNPDVIAQGGKS